MAPFLMVPRTRGIINFGIPQRCLFFVVYQSTGLKIKKSHMFCLSRWKKKEVHFALPSLNASAMRQRHTIKSNLVEGKGKAYDETAVTSSGALFGSI